MKHFLNASIRCSCAKCNKIANDEDKEKKVDELEEESRRAEEHDKEKKEKELESYRAEARELDDDELDEELVSLRAEIEELKKPKKDTKEARRSRYDVLGYNQMYSVSHSGDDFLIKQGSRD